MALESKAAFIAGPSAQARRRAVAFIVLIGTVSLFADMTFEPHSQKKANNYDVAEINKLWSRRIGKIAGDMVAARVAMMIAVRYM